MMARKPTIYEALQSKLGRTPTNAELKREVERIKREAVQDLAIRGKLPFQRRRNPAHGRMIPAKLQVQRNGSIKVLVDQRQVRRVNPSSRFPGLSSWSMFAGGAFAAKGKHGYDLRIDGQTYTISPHTTKYGRHAGYLLSVYPGVPARGHHQLGDFRSPQKAVAAARKFHQDHVTTGGY
jgi:hypothetical protein